MVSTCGTVMSMVKTDRPRKTFSSPPTGRGLFGSVTQAPSAGSIAMASLLMTRAHRVARNRIAPGGSLASRPRAKHLGVCRPVFGKVQPIGKGQARQFVGHRQRHRHLAVILLAELPT